MPASFTKQVKVILVSGKKTPGQIFWIRYLLCFWSNIWLHYHGSILFLKVIQFFREESYKDSFQAQNIPQNKLNEHTSDVEVSFYLSNGDVTIFNHHFLNVFYIFIRNSFIGITQLRQTLSSIFLFIVKIVMHYWGVLIPPAVGNKLIDKLHFWHSH